MKNKPFQVLLLLFVMFSHSLAKQPLTLEECIDVALRKNLQHQRDKQTLALSHLDLESAYAPFKFNMDAVLSTPTFLELRDTQESLALATRVRDESTNFRYSGALRMSQRLSHFGTFTVTSNAERRDFSSNRRKDFLDFSGDMRLDYTHQILNRPSEEIALQRARFNLSNAKLSYIQQLLILEGQVIDDFYALVQSIRQLKIQEERMKLSEANQELAQRKFEVGLIAEVEVLRLKVEVLQAESSFTQAETAIERQRDQLRQTLGLESNEQLKIRTEVDHRLYRVDREQAIRIGLEKRTDMHQNEITQKLLALNLENTKRLNGINATLNANFSLRGRGDEIGDVSSSLERNQWGAGIEITMPLIDNGSKRSSIEQARIQLEQNKLSKQQQQQQVVKEIRNATRNLDEAANQIAIGEASLQLAERTYEIEQSRFELGLAKSQDLLNAQNQLTQARIDGLNAIINYQRNLKDLRLATMANLEELVSHSPNH